MKNQKRKTKITIQVIIASIIILGIGTSIFIKINTNNNKQVQTFNQKIEKVEEKIVKNKTPKQKNEAIILSICNKQKQAIVRSKQATTIKKAYKQAKKEIEKYIQNNSYEAEWIKISIIKQEKTITYPELQEQIRAAEANSYRKGIQLKDVILSEAEINANQLLNYETGTIDLAKVNTYLQSQEKETIKQIPETVKIFDEEGYFIDEKETIYEISTSELEKGRRKKQDTNLEEILKNASNYLANMIKENGKYQYEYKTLENQESEDYNILRHAGSLWSLIVTLEKHNQAEKIEQALAYLLDNIETLGDEAYTIEEKSKEIKLGGNALSTIAICEYSEKFNNKEQLEIAKKLANGILKMQKEEGSFVHVLEPKKHTLKEEFRTVYYDGEATFALAKLYGLTQDTKYLQAAEKAMENLIKKDYVKYGDHWIEYAVNEITKYAPKKQYYEFGLKNVEQKLDTIYNKKITSHIDFEMLMQCFEIYKRIEEEQIPIDYLQQFPKEKFLETIEYRANYQLNSYLYPEVAMYLKSPEKYQNSFYIRTDNYRIRIDDIQHSLLGYHFYHKNYEKIQLAIQKQI